MNSIKWVSNSQLPPTPNCRLEAALSGRILFEGSIRELNRLVLTRTFSTDGFGLTENHDESDKPISSEHVHPMYSIDDKDPVKELQEIIDLIDWSKPDPIIKVVFASGFFHDYKIVSYHKWYMHNSLALAYKPSTRKTYTVNYAFYDSIPHTWIEMSKGTWYPPSFGDSSNNNPSI